MLQNCPPPSHTFLKADELDKSVANGQAKKVGTTAATIALQQDAMHKKHQLKVIQPMGPLGKLWLKLEEARKSKQDSELNLQKALDLTEESIMLVGQSNVAIRHARQVKMTHTITRDLGEARYLGQAV